MPSLKDPHGSTEFILRCGKIWGRVDVYKTSKIKQRYISTIASAPYQKRLISESWCIILCKRNEEDRLSWQHSCLPHPWSLYSQIPMPIFRLLTACACVSILYLALNQRAGPLTSSNQLGFEKIQSPPPPPREKKTQKANLSSYFKSKAPVAQRLMEIIPPTYHRSYFQI